MELKWAPSFWAAYSDETSFLGLTGNRGETNLDGSALRKANRARNAFNTTSKRVHLASATADSPTFWIRGPLTGLLYCTVNTCHSVITHSGSNARHPVRWFGFVGNLSRVPLSTFKETPKGELPFDLPAYSPMFGRKPNPTHPSQSLRIVFTSQQREIWSGWPVSISLEPKKRLVNTGQLPGGA